MERGLPAAAESAAKGTQRGACRHTSLVGHLTKYMQDHWRQLCEASLESSAGLRGKKQITESPLAACSGAGDGALRHRLWDEIPFAANAGGKTADFRIGQMHDVT